MPLPGQIQKLFAMWGAKYLIFLTFTIAGPSVYKLPTGSIYKLLQIWTEEASTGSGQRKAGNSGFHLNSADYAFYLVMIFRKHDKLLMC